MDSLLAAGGTAFWLGLGTGLPVLALALPMALGARWVGAAARRLAIFERWARRITAVVFILVGLYESGRSLLGVW